MLSTRVLTRFAGLLASALMLAASPVFAQDNAATTPPPAEEADLLGFLVGDHVLGNEKAPVRVIEYASLSCSHCMRSHTQTFPELKKNYIDTGKIAYIYRHFPLNEPALRGAMLAECSGEQFFTYLNVMFQSQPQWAYTEDFQKSLLSIARVGGMGDEAFDACMANKELEDRLVSHLKLAASQLKIQSTPTLFVNGTKLDGFHSYEQLSQIIDAELKAAAQ